MNLIPQPPLNGGLYTGEPFHPNAPWRNFPVIPTASYMNHVNLRSANPPIQALFLMDSGVRPGNNSSDPSMPGVVRFTGDKNFGPFSSILCMPCLKKIECSCGYDCDCKELCNDNKNDSCACKTNKCPTKWIPID
jgi:hypothetical protein